jgi:hypothetical protein
VGDGGDGGGDKWRTVFDVRVVLHEFVDVLFFFSSLLLVLVLREREVSADAPIELDWCQFLAEKGGHMQAGRGGAGRGYLVFLLVLVLALRFLELLDGLLEGSRLGIEDAVFHLSVSLQPPTHPPTAAAAAAPVM